MDFTMKSISALAIVSIIALLLAIGLIYMIVKPPKTITTTSIYIPTTETITETIFIPTTYIFTTTYTYTTTYQTPPTTITRTITEIITYTYAPEEKIEITLSSFHHCSSPPKDMGFVFYVVNKEYSLIYIDPNKPVLFEGKGILNNTPDDLGWWIDTSLQREPFILSGSPYNPPKANFVGILRHNKHFNPNEIKIGQQYRVIYLNGTWSDWKSYSFNITYEGY